jgi:putative protein kinase ArgK-like GTPase of G3E family
MGRKMSLSNYLIHIKYTLNGKKEAVAKALNLVESRNPLTAQMEIPDILVINKSD